jgi:hypothetical protein
VRRSAVRLGVLTTAFALAATTVVLAHGVERVGADPLADADATIDALRRDADQAAQEHFDALARATELDTTIEHLEAQLPDLVARRKRLQRHVEDRAVAAYMRSGSQLATLIDSGDALTAARRRQLLARLNERDHDAFVELTKVSRRLEEQRGQLRAARAEQEAALAALTERGRELDAKLQAAVARRSALQAEAAAAAARAAAAAAATAAAPTAGDSGDGGPGTGAPPADIPTAPPAGYQPTPGVHPHHDDPFLACTRAHESSGNYAAVNPAGPYLGAYQFLQSTWNGGANHAGRLDLVGVPPNTASEYDQDDVAWTVYQWQGTGPWGGRC